MAEETKAKSKKTGNDKKDRNDKMAIVKNLIEKGKKNGWIGAVLLTFMLMLILSLAMIKFELNDNIYSIIFTVITVVSLVIGAVLAARNNGERGWLTGGIVGLLFFVFIFVFSSVINGSFAFDITQIYKLIGCFGVGTIAGILGINL